jgi:lathosterol oxidase
MRFFSKPHLMLPYDLSAPLPFLILTALMFLAVSGRYFLISGAFHLVFYCWFPDRFRQRKLNQVAYPPEQFQREMRWSLITALLFALMGALTAVAWQKGYTAIYLEVKSFTDWLYAFFSLALAMFIHETYYYWLHRWMHLPGVYRLIHKVHHESRITSAWTAFAFHPLEGLLEGLILPLIVFILPLHPYTIVVHLSLMTLTAAVNHLDIEVYPSGFYNKAPWKWLIGATHHSHHHRFYTVNYGLYFTLWDKWAGTESATFREEFEDKTRSLK